MHVVSPLELDLAALRHDLRDWARELGFQAVGVADLDLGEAPGRLAEWLAAGLHGDMDWLRERFALRTDPRAILPDARSAVLVRMDYRPARARDPHAVLADPERAYVSRYALGRDYHKVLRGRLRKLAERLGRAVGPFQYRVFADSAPVMEVELARKAGLGWRGKHTLLLDRGHGSEFFLGGFYTDLPFAPDAPTGAHCGSCENCIHACPTRAIIGPHRLDARRCISYLTIEHKGAIPEEFRAAIGNRIYGCDDCQLVCPWNRFASACGEADFAPRHGLDAARLVELFAWTADEFDEKMAGSAVRRIGHERWLRNLAVALGNAPTGPAVIAALRARLDHPSALVREHVNWALARHAGAAPAPGLTEHPGPRPGARSAPR